MDDKSTRNIESIEELTLFTIDKTCEGLDCLINKAESCGTDIAENRMSDGIAQLSSLVGELHDFDMFEHNLCSIFNLDRAIINDAKGDLETNANSFRETLHKIGNSLEQNDLNALSVLLKTDLAKSLARFKELMPLLRIYIDKEYIQPENKG